ncbi:hypothetical protein [Streptomyces sp. NPDC057694]
MTVSDIGVSGRAFTLMAILCSFRRLTTKNSDETAQLAVRAPPVA